MNKNTRLLLIVGALAVAGYLAFRWYSKKKAAAANQSPTGSLGTNLNSVAPELIGGSTGPSVGPVLSSPINITLNETNPQTEPEDEGEHQEGANAITGTNPMRRQKQSAGAVGTQPRSPGVTQGIGLEPSPMVEHPKTQGPSPKTNTTVERVNPSKKSAAKSPPAKRTTIPMKVR